MVEALLYVHRNRRLIRDGEPRTSTSTFTQLLNSEQGDHTVWEISHKHKSGKQVFTSEAKL